MLEKQALADVDEKGFVPDEVRNAFFRKLRMKSENRSCFECTARNPTWISLSYGVYLCLECSGEHRRKGVHISFVRSVELDRFTPEQMIQMACGGNGKAWEYFKQSGMGKTSDAGRAIDYNSKIAQRYKLQIEKDTATSCENLAVSFKAPTKAPSADSADEVLPSPDPPVRGASAPGALGNYPKAAPAAAKAAPAKAAPAVTAPAVVKVNTPSVVAVAAPPSPSGVSLTAAPKPSGFAAKQKAKEIDFDFDFDQLESEASKPAPVATPKAAGGSTPSPKQGGSSKPPIFAAMNEVAAPRPAAAAVSEVTAKFTAAKAISSDDFFHQAESESAAARMERESRYHKFAGAGAISSSSFFADGEAAASGAPRSPTTDMDDWKAVASVAASRGSEFAKAGLSRGAELLTTYLNKVRD